MSEDLTRRQAVKRLLKLGGTAALTVGLYGGLLGRDPLAESALVTTRKADFRIPDDPGRLVIVRGAGQPSAESLVRTAIERLGGMSRFVSRGDVVALKPNMSWDRPPELAANTSPAVIQAVVDLCFQAGAAKVNLVDNTINDPRRIFRNACIDTVAAETGARLVYPASDHFKTIPLQGRRLGDWKVYTPVIEADKLINLPVAKHHGLTTLTLGMKNWIGAVGGSRGALHQDIHQSIVDLAGFFKPTLVIMDATRIMIRNGPSGGRISDVVIKNTVIAGSDQVAVDAAATELFDLFPDDVPHIIMAEQQGLGLIDPGPNHRIYVDL